MKWVDKYPNINIIVLLSLFLLHTAVLMGHVQCTDAEELCFFSTQEIQKVQEAKS